MTYYDSIADSYDRLHKEEQLKKLKVIKELLAGKITPETTLLDVGCGTGFSLDFFGCQATGVDPSIKLLKQATHKVIEAKAERLPFPDKAFDIVISVTAIHNFDDIEKGIQEIKRVSGGWVVVTILKGSGKFSQIRGWLLENFKLEKEAEAAKDVILLLRK